MKEEKVIWLKNEKHVLVIYPHPDDESFGAAGTITKFRELGVPVTYVCGTLGEMGRNMGSPIIANRETLPEIRKKELEEACKELDIGLHLLGYRDKTLEFEDTQEVAQHIKQVIEEYDASLVITHYPDYGVHPDHNALGLATIEAVRMMDKDKRPTVWAAAIEKGFEEKLGQPDIIHDVTDIFDKKIAAIVKHKSQAGGIIESLAIKQQGEVVARLERLKREQFFIWKFDHEESQQGVHKE